MSGKGTIYSYQIVAHTVIPGFRDWVPFPIVLVELDEQSGQPAPGDGLRLTANLVDADMNPEQEENVAIGKRVEVVFQDGEDGLTPAPVQTIRPGTTWRGLAVSGLAFLPWTPATLHAEQVARCRDNPNAKML